MNGVPYDPTRQTHSNDLGRSDWDTSSPAAPAELVRACQACGLTDPGPVFCRWCNALLDE